MPAEDAKISVFDHGVLYGDGVFEGARFYNKKVFKLSKHFARLRRSLHALDIQLPYSEDEFREGIDQCIQACGIDDGYIRILVTRGVGNLGLNPANCGRASCAVIAAPLTMTSEEANQRGLKLITASTKRMTGSGLDSRVKSLNYLHSIMAKTEANFAKADDAVLLNQSGRVAECSAANIFIYSDGKLRTTPATEGALEGITRQTIIELAAELAIPVVIEALTPWDIYNAEECFVSGSGIRLVAVAELDGRKIETINGPIFSKLNEAFQALVRR